MAAVSQVQHIEKSNFAQSWLREALLVIGGSIFIALFAHIAIPLPFTPVPLSLQMNACLFLGILLGSKRAAAAVVLFLIQGACGLPVFSTGASGIAKLFGPTGGYLLGYVAGAYLVGYLWEKAKVQSTTRAFLAMAAGNLVVYALGVFHLSQFVGLNRALLLGVAPFIIGDLLKLFLGVRTLRLARHIR